jgi:post-segregation antitoxin (ccd killing protein)
MARLNITVPDGLYERIEKWRDRINLSRICQEAIRRELDKLEQVPEQVHEMREALARLEREKAKIERSCFRKGVYDGLEWARGADYASLKRWGGQPPTAEALEEALRGPAARFAAAHSGDPGWEPWPYAEGWIAGVNQFWERAKNHL